MPTWTISARRLSNGTRACCGCFDKDLEQNARRQAVEELRLAALQNGILNDASERARSQLTILLYQVGFTEVNLRSK